MPTPAEDYLNAYGEHSRTWLVAYGIGAPVLLMTSDAMEKAIFESGSARLIAGFFLIGVALQVLLSATNKASMWALYYGETAPSFKNSRLYKLGYAVSERYWIDFVIDVATLFIFGYATWKAFSAVLRAET